VFNGSVLGGVAREFVAAAARAATAAALPTPTSWQLRGETGTVAGRIVALEAEVKLGRDSTQCGVHVDEPTVSREHALLLPEADGAAWRVRRLSRTAPVLVNDEAHDDVRLRIGDRLQVGTAVFVVESA
jgi:hypothetical protein